MKLDFKARDWHNWISVILLLPMLLVGMTAIFIAHNNALGLNDIEVTGAVRWLPGYGTQAMKAAGMEVRSSLLLADGSRWVGTKSGLYRIAEGKAVAIAELGDTEVRDIITAPWGVVVAAKSGIWVQMRESWHRMLDGDAWNASLAPDGSVTVVLKDYGLATSRDGHIWQAESATLQVLAALPANAVVAERITLGKLMTDLHTGKAFLGKSVEWVWIDLLGGIWVFLGFTGLWMWWKSQTKRRDAARARLMQEAPHG